MFVINEEVKTRTLESMKVPAAAWTFLARGVLVYCMDPLRSRNITLSPLRKVHPQRILRCQYSKEEPE